MSKPDITKQLRIATAKMKSSFGGVDHAGYLTPSDILLLHEAGLFKFKVRDIEAAKERKAKGLSGGWWTYAPINRKVTIKS